MCGEDVIGIIREEFLGRTVREVRPFIPSCSWRLKAESLGCRQFIGEPCPSKGIHEARKQRMKPRTAGTAAARNPTSKPCRNGSGRRERERVLFMRWSPCTLPTLSPAQRLRLGQP